MEDPRYDPGTKQIYLPRGKIKGLPNKLGHEIGHAKIDEWGSVGINDAGLGRNFKSGIKRGMLHDVSVFYEEVSTDILMKERYGDSVAGDVVREKINFETRSVSRMVADSFKKSEEYHGLGELSSYRDRAEIFNLPDIKAKIDSELKTQHGIDVNSSIDSIGVEINNLTNAYCGLQGLNSEKFKGNFKNIDQWKSCHNKNPFNKSIPLFSIPALCGNI